MEEIIKAELKRIEKEHGIEILYACESGSRCWGFASPDSDYDVRFIYKHNPSWYLNIHEQKSTLEFPINDLLDIGGWELRKALQLLHKSNAPLLEWLQSPIVYQQDEQFLHDIQILSQSCYSPIAVFHHYQSMALKCREEMEGPSFKLKKFFYTLRAALAARCTIVHGNVPPVQLKDLLYTIGVETSIRKLIAELVTLKSEQNEGYIHPSSTELTSFIDEVIALNQAESNQLKPAKPDVKGINDLLYRKVMA